MRLELTGVALNFWRAATDTLEVRSADLLLAEVRATLRVAAGTFGGIDDEQNSLYQALRLSARASRTYLSQLGLGYDPRPFQVLQE